MRLKGKSYRKAASKLDMTSETEAGVQSKSLSPERLRVVEPNRWESLGDDITVSGFAMRLQRV
jgi:hypothetical protein